MPTSNPTPPPADDDALITAGKNDRSRTLAKLYQEMARSVNCDCGWSRFEHAQNCPASIWQQAARMAEQMIEE